jgi:hypothetical protein
VGPGGDRPVWAAPGRTVPAAAGTVVSVLVEAEARGLPVGAGLTRLAGLLPVRAEPAGALREVLSGWEPPNRPWLCCADLVAGLVPRARGIEDEDVARAVREREDLIARRAREFAEEAVQGGEKWARPFGSPPTGSTPAEGWWDRLAVIAAYRDGWHIGGPGILGDEPGAGSLQQAA